MRCKAGALRAALLLASLPVAAGETHHWWDKFEDWRASFAKEYAPAEKMARFQTFVTNYVHILEENAKGHTYKLDLNIFSDLSPDEFAATRLGLKRPVTAFRSLPLLGTHKRGNSTLPESVDWAAEGAVGPVKDQGACGSCWAFSAVGALESAWKIATGDLALLSEQQFVDCGGAFGTSGCSGGLMDGAFAFAEGHALCTAQSYPYSAADGSCSAASRACVEAIPQGAVSGYRDVASNDQHALMEALVHGPVSVAIEADRWVLQHYSSGIISNDCGSTVDHGVLAVGYGTEGNLSYWLVRNSWGPRWGMNGYVKLLRGVGGAGECGILTMASYPVVRALNSTPAPAPEPEPAPAPEPEPAPEPAPQLGLELVDVLAVLENGTTTTPREDGKDQGGHHSPTATTTEVASSTTARPTSKQAAPCRCVSVEHPEYGFLEAKCKDHLRRGEAPWCYVLPQASCSTELFESGALPKLRWRWCEKQASLVSAAAGQSSLWLPVLLSLVWSSHHLRPH